MLHLFYRGFGNANKIFLSIAAYTTKESYCVTSEQYWHMFRLKQIQTLFIIPTQDKNRHKTKEEGEKEETMSCI